MQETALDKLRFLRQERERLTGAYVEELRNERARLLNEIAILDTQIGALKGSKVSANSKVVSLESLLSMLKAAGGRINIRKERLDLAAIRRMVASHGEVLGIQENSAWPYVVLKGS